MVSWHFWMTAHIAAYWAIIEILHHIISEEFAVCLSGQISSSMIPVLLICPFLSSPILSPSLLPTHFQPPSFSPLFLWFIPLFLSIRPSVCLVFSVPAAESLQDHQSFPSTHTWPTFSAHTCTHASTYTHTRYQHTCINTNPCAHMQTHVVCMHEQALKNTHVHTNAHTHTHIRKPEGQSDPSVNLEVNHTDGTSRFGSESEIKTNKVICGSVVWGHVLATAWVWVRLTSYFTVFSHSLALLIIECRYADDNIWCLMSSMFYIQNSFIKCNISIYLGIWRLKFAGLLVLQTHTCTVIATKLNKSHKICTHMFF